MEKIKGKVEAVSDKEGRYGIKVLDIWYSGFGKPPADKDDEIEFEFEVNGTFRNIKNVISVNFGTKTESKEVHIGDSDTSFYTSYAKDIFSVLLQEKTLQKLLISNEELMDQAIELVKKARLSFS